MKIFDIYGCSDYELQEERNRLYAHIWQHGTDNCDKNFLEYYREVCLELEFRDQNSPKATIHAIK